MSLVEAVPPRDIVEVLPILPRHLRSITVIPIRMLVVPEEMEMGIVAHLLHHPS
jgi:hypothetical protein